MASLRIKENNINYKQNRKYVKKKKCRDEFVECRTVSTQTGFEVEETQTNMNLNPNSNLTHKRSGNHRDSDTNLSSQKKKQKKIHLPRQTT